MDAELVEELQDALDIIQNALLEGHVVCGIIIEKEAYTLLDAFGEDLRVARHSEKVVEALLRDGENAEDSSEQSGDDDGISSWSDENTSEEEDLFDRFSGP